MILYFVLGAVVLAAALVVGILFFLLNKETKSEVSIVPILKPQDFIKPVEVSAQELEYKRQVEDLENELRSISEKGVAQAQEAVAMIDTLTKENEALKAINAKIGDEQKAQLDMVEQQATQLRGENTALQSQLEASHVKFERLQEEMTVITKQLGGELSQATATIAKVRAEKEEVIAARDAASQPDQAMARQIDELKAANAELRQQLDDVRLTGQKLKELNDSMMEKNQILQYELTRNRAQASGLEKICEGYKIQLSRIQELQGNP